jgi:DnaJ-class molecular chaperone
MKKCERCGGLGRTNKGVPKEDIIADDGKIPCPDCEGEGEIMCCDYCTEANEDDDEILTITICRDCAEEHGLIDKY